MIAIGLSMDAVSVSVATGVRAQKRSQQEGLRLALFFGFFQGAMPVIGWVIGSAAAGTISSISGPIACALLCVVGIKMVVESRRRNNEEKSQKLGYKELVLLSIATSIDALIVGTSIRLVDLPLGISVAVIGVVTSILCYVAYFSAHHFGKLFGKNIEIAGGVILIMIGFTFLFR